MRACVHARVRACVRAAVAVRCQGPFPCRIQIPRPMSSRVHQILVMFIIFLLCSSHSTRIHHTLVVLKSYPCHVHHIHVMFIMFTSCSSYPCHVHHIHIMFKSYACRVNAVFTPCSHTSDGEVHLHGPQHRVQRRDDAAGVLRHGGGWVTCMCVCVCVCVCVCMCV